jgi:SAM-dependent methyltransferase
MLSSLREWYQRQQFNPGVLGAFFNPFYLARRSLWQGIAVAAPMLSGRLLDVGCGRKPYRGLFKVDSYVGLEIDSTTARARGHADYFYDGTRFPFADGSFDSVICNQVLEHVFNPDDFVTELGRILSKEGQLLLTVPFVWDEHEQPYDYARYSSFGVTHLLEAHGFKVIRQDKTLADFSIIAQLINAYTFKCTRTRSFVINSMTTAILMAPVSLIGLFLGKILPGNPDLFLDSVVLARKLS